ncbi:desulfoferrodoxin family protein [Sulfurospirillum arcachonense]|uniref:desulfoferrodoxin family protein n=1 Tax=Sulfurospirillum arcachonense TaxID=57666 RepID=UPI00046A3715|nr:desulfoferrodoxin family protein [Sulfurospirillum arcachonense]
MDRRNALKIAALAAMSATVANAYDKKLVVNTKDMKIKDPANPTKAELKHSPEIKIGEKDAKGFALVEVNIGQQGIIHPSVKNHWIYEVDLFADGVKVANVALEPMTSRGYLASRVNLEKVKMISATSKCNLHGNYTSSVNV